MKEKTLPIFTNVSQSWEEITNVKLKEFKVLITLKTTSIFSRDFMKKNLINLKSKKAISKLFTNVWIQFTLMKILDEQVRRKQVVKLDLD